MISCYYQQDLTRPGITPKASPQTSTPAYSLKHFSIPQGGIDALRDGNAGDFPHKSGWTAISFYADSISVIRFLDKKLSWSICSIEHRILAGSRERLDCPRGLEIYPLHTAYIRPLSGGEFGGYLGGGIEEYVGGGVEEYVGGGIEEYVGKGIEEYVGSGTCMDLGG